MPVKTMSATVTYAYFTQFSARVLKATTAVAFLTFLGLSEAAATICVQESIQLERVQGIVLAEEGEFLLPGVTLTLERKGARFERVEISDHEGFFSFATVPEGDYFLRVELEGFGPHEATIRVRKGSNLSQVLVVTLPSPRNFDSCGYTAMTSGRKARHLQQEILNRDTGNSRREIRNALEPPERTELSAGAGRPPAQNPGPQPDVTASAVPRGWARGR